MKLIETICKIFAAGTAMLRPGHFDETHRYKSVLLLLQVQLCRDQGILMKLIETNL